MSLWQRPKNSIPPGIYDEIISQAVAQELERKYPGLLGRISDFSDSNDVDEEILALVSNAFRLALESRTNATDKMELAQAVLKPLQDLGVIDPQEAILERKILQSVGTIDFSKKGNRPKGSLLSSGLITNNAGESILDFLTTEFASSDSIDLLCSFIKVSGLDKFRDFIEKHRSSGKRMRVLTTTYMRATEARAIEMLHKMGVEIKISYDESATRLHAKAWLFHRESQYSSGYVGSSNLSHSAQTDGLEWNVRVTQSDQENLFDAMSRTFETYWLDADSFELFDGSEKHKQRLQNALSEKKGNSEEEDFSGLELEPRWWQKPILRELSVAREAGRHQNLVLMATGTGKTWVSAFDYRDLLLAKKVDSLLFVAHRKEILTQSRKIFAWVLGRPGFGELWVDGEVPNGFRYVFASVQSASDSKALVGKSFDYVVIDEAHHTAAATYQTLLKSLTPKELVGMTATPERSDNKQYGANFPQPYVGNLRVWEAIQQQILVPFRYFALDTDIDLADVAWNGKYNEKELSRKLIGAAELWTHSVTRGLREHVADLKAVRALAFCVDIAHATAVAEHLEKNLGLRARSLVFDTPNEDRRNAKRALQNGEVQVLCVVDLFNEGVDIPSVNTLFMFRPTESATVFLQQIGRGLRRHREKDILTIFDLTGRQHPKFRFDRHLRGLLGMTNRELGDFLETGLGRLPSGCQIKFEEQTQEDILQRVKQAIPSDMKGIIELLKENKESAWDLPQFLRETGVDLFDIYRKKSGAGYFSWDALNRSAGLTQDRLLQPESEALENIHKLLHVRDTFRLGAWKKFIAGKRPGSKLERRIANMLFAVLYGNFDTSTFEMMFDQWLKQSALRHELGELIKVLQEEADLLPHQEVYEGEYPLVTHGCYLDVEISAALDLISQDGRIRHLYTGVEKALAGRCDLILTTMKKGTNIQEHLKYKDYALDERTFHWQSKARSRQDDATGQRHIKAKELGVTPLLFVRDSKTDARGVTNAFRFLGSVNAASYYGERPISIVWNLETAMLPEWMRNWRLVA